MCRKDIASNDYTEEHIFPKWLQNKVGLWDEKLTLLDGTGIFYRNLKVPCCNDCNEKEMSRKEKLIRNAVCDGYDAICKLDKNILAWWLSKIYYSILVKETQLTSHTSHNKKNEIFPAKNLAFFEKLYDLMHDLHMNKKFVGECPYEVFLFKTKTSNFNYYDGFGNTCLIQLGDAVFICSFSSYGFCEKHYKEELDALNKLDSIHEAQAAELYCKFAYLNAHLELDYNRVEVGDKVFIQVTNYSVSGQNEELNGIVISFLSQRFGIEVITKDLSTSRVTICDKTICS